MSEPEQIGEIRCFAGTVADVTDLKKAEEQLGRRADLAALVADVARRFVSVGPEELDEAITWTLERIGQAGGADRASIVDLEDEVLITHEWRADPLAPSVGERFELPPEMLRAGKAAVRAAGTTGPFELPDSLLRSGRIESRSLEVVPLLSGDLMLGALAVGSLRSDRPWGHDFRIALHSLGSVLASAIQRIRISRELQRSLDLSRTLLDTIPSPVFHKDRSGRYLGCNDAFASFLGRRRDAIVGRTVYEIGQGPQADAHKAADDELFERKGQQVHEGQARRADGSLRDVVFSKATWTGPDGDVAGIVGVITDVTERNRADRTVRQHQTQLRALSARLALVEERERRRSARLLHDEVGQELALLKLRLGLVARAAGGDTARQLGELRERVTALIQRTRDMTRDLAPPALFKLGLAAALESLASEQLAPHDLELEVAEEGTPLPLDEGLQLFAWRATRELLTNTLKHAAASRVELAIRWEGGHLHLSVDDDGQGFDPTVMSPETGPDAAGFGLIQLRERLLHMGGDFAVRSAPGQGTRVCLTVPTVSLAPGAQER